ncbi:glycosyl transferase [Paenibacillus sp. H1-7]|uniref:glycosyltransferase WbsX family protein n=1 Tax=Paenibacillus sp. H1-7 TaxID=2282849 RepID=UPI001EF797D4|nr:glycoside hydrolase family 99-like domain-containing protein [Paenibacillus sp. H1-7]ULL20090.1 glycosyl transferase [Paenibacillus sp. H1-7]
MKSTQIKPKIIAFYLPQFHRIPENDLWWGEGFSEWTNTRKAKPLFPGHYQPREPQGDHYYDLINPKTKSWQAELARHFGIYGFCYYHYWFKGKLLLETPLQQMLESGKPDFPFCLSWANESWTRGWDGADHEVLMPQQYGNKDDWKRHFEYLLRAFKDPRYIRVNNKPLFAIYRPATIEHCTAMMNYWQQLARQHGLKGIHFVETLSGFPRKPMDGFQASLQFEPLYTTTHDLPENAFSEIVIRESSMETDEKKLRLYSYDNIWNRIIAREIPSSGKPSYLGAFIDWDNSPRKGENASFIYNGATPAKFGAYLQQQLGRAKRSGTEFVFINAWNEWAEGTYLEPDKIFGLQYLEAVKHALESESVWPLNRTSQPQKRRPKMRTRKTPLSNKHK